MSFLMPTPKEKPKAAMLHALREAADLEGRLDYSTFVSTALYAPEIGYYASRRERVGRHPDSDFYTARSLGPVFGRLVAAACENLLGPESAKSATFVEIGAEPGSATLDDVEHSFADVRVLRLGDPLTVSGNVVVFANEWLDAQPFRRFRRDAERGWVERGVSIDKDGTLKETDLPEKVFADLHPTLPEQAPAGYLLDLPVGAADALSALVSQPWTGLFLTLDYGLPLRAFFEERPEGMARAYRLHRVSADLLTAPGEQDLTCHVCWDLLEEILRQKAFSEVTVERQETFFLQRAANVCEAIVTQGSDGRLSPERQTLLELLHPGNMGARFQALFGLRKKTGGASSS